MKPLYRFKYDFPNEKVHKQYIKDAIQNLMSEEKLYQNRPWQKDPYPHSLCP